MPSPKTPAEILDEYSYFKKEHLTNAWLRSSMQSLLLHVMGEMPKLREVNADMETLSWLANSSTNNAIQLCLAVIQSTIDSIKE